jgi:hypothetical protein
MNNGHVKKAAGYHRLEVGMLAVVVAAMLATMWPCLAQAVTIQWRLGPDYPMGIQDSAMGFVNGKLVSAGGFTRYPLDIVQKYPDAFGGDSSGFTKLTLLFDPQHESAGWTRIADMPGPARQGEAVAVVNNALYAIGGINYSAPYTYRDTYRLQEVGGQWNWQELPSAQFPWPVYGNAASTAVVGSKIYLCGAADYFQGPRAVEPDFHSEAGRDGSPVGNALLVLDTNNISAGWQRLADCPGLPKFDTALAAVGGKIYQLGGDFAPLAKMDSPYYNAVDSWMYDPASNQWTQLPDMPDGANRRAMVCKDRYIILAGGYTYPKTWHLNGTITDAPNVDGFEDTVMVYDTATGSLSSTDSLMEQTSLPSATAVGDILYTLGGEGGPRTFHPATLQIGQVSVPEPRMIALILGAGACLALWLWLRQRNDHRELSRS